MKGYMVFVLKVELSSREIQPSHFQMPFSFNTFISHTLCAFNRLFFFSQQMLRPNDGRGRNLLKSPF